MRMSGAGFCGGRDGDGHLFWGLHFSPVLHVWELPPRVHAPHGALAGFLV